MKLIASFFIFITSVASFSQIKVSVYNEKTDTGYTILVDNSEFCPVSVFLNLELTNLTSGNGNDKIFVIPAQTKKFPITTLQIIQPNTPYGFKTKTRSNYGDSTLTDYTDYTYSLPFQTGKSFAVFQGYNGSFSHQNENSLDFTMPVGTQVVAARDGIVIKVVANNNLNCAEKKCAEYNNYVLLYHNDGTFSKYIHLKMNGVVVKEGAIVKENDLLGYSGNTGWSNGPHLHFMVYLQRIDKVETIKTKFKIDDGTAAELLTERVMYLKNY